MFPQLFSQVQAKPPAQPGPKTYAVKTQNVKIVQGSEYISDRYFQFVNVR